MSLHASRCGVRNVDEWQMARLLGAYGTGRTCHSMPWARKRAHLWAKLMKEATLEPGAPPTGRQGRGTGKPQALPGRVLGDALTPRRPPRAKSVMLLSAP